MGPRRWWTAPVNVEATVAGRLPGALLGAVLFVAAGSMLGPVGLLLALWLVAGALTAFRFAERAVARAVLRYRPAPESWLEAEVRRLLPGRRVDVYVAPKATGVFALGGRSIGHAYTAGRAFCSCPCHPGRRGDHGGGEGWLSRAALTGFRPAVGTSSPSANQLSSVWS